MAATLSEYIAKSVSLKGAKTSLVAKVRILGYQYKTLSGFKNASMINFNALKDAEGNPLISPLTAKEFEILSSVQNDIDTHISLEANFVKLLTSDFVGKQKTMLSNMKLSDINSNPLLCNALNLDSLSDFIKYNVYALATRSIVTSMGYFVQNLLLYASPDIHDGKNYQEGIKSKWDLVVEKLNEVKSYIEVKSGPNDLDAGQVKSYRDEILDVESKGFKGYIGITYGKRNASTVSINLFKQYLENWEDRTLIGSELSTTRNYKLPSGQQVMFTDTVGFIRKLPHHLIDAFRSTLEEAKYADILIHVVDSSNPQMDAHMHIVYETLANLGVEDKKIITLFNKQDKLEEKPILKDFKADYTIDTSIKFNKGLEELIERIEDILRDQKIYFQKTFGYNEAGNIQLIRKYGELLTEEYKGDGIYVEAYVPLEIYSKL